MKNNAKGFMLDCYFCSRQIEPNKPEQTYESPSKTPLDISVLQVFYQVLQESCQCYIRELSVWPLQLKLSDLWFDWIT